MMRALFLTEGTTVPSTRFRVGQFIPHFERNGIQCTVRAGYTDAYNAISRTQLGAPYKLACRLKRVAMGLDAHTFDLVFLQRPAIPFTPLPELMIRALTRHTVFDFDDNLTIGKGGQPNPARQRTLELAAQWSGHVIAGNRYLAGLVDVDEHLTIIPTVIDTDLYTPGPSRFRRDDELVIGWMGTSGNFTYLRDIIPAITQVLQGSPLIKLRIVSNARLPELEGHPQIEQIWWSAQDEVELLRSFDIGLMPLRDSLGARGKCGFKMIQYMATGAAVVSSPVGANVDIFEGSQAGFLAQRHQDWVEALSLLIEDANARKQRGQAARAHAEHNYSIKGVLGRYLEIFERVASR